MISDNSISETIDIIQEAEKMYPVSSVEKNICSLLLFFSKRMFDDRKEPSNSSKAPLGYESLNEFCNKNNFGKSTLFDYIKKNNITNKPYFYIGATKRNAYMYFIDPIPFLKDLIEKASSKYLIKKAERSYELYKREKKVNIV